MADTFRSYDIADSLRCILELRAKVEALKARVSELQSCHNTTADHLLDIIAMVRGTFSTEAKPATAGSPCMIPPANCRQRLQREGKPYPKTSCEACGPMSPLWLKCDADLEVEAARPVAPPAAPAPAGVLVQELAFLIAGFASTARVGDCAEPTAREVLRKMAAWFRTIAPSDSVPWRMAAEVLEQEANQ